MKYNYKLFNFQQYINNLRLPYKRMEKPDDDIKKMLDAITDDMTIEDTTFYKEYLSKFDIAKAFEGYKLITNPNSKATNDDYFMLLRLICASFSTTDYIVSFDEENKTVEFTIRIENEEGIVIRKLQELQYLHIITLMEWLIKDQIKMEAFRTEAQSYREEIDLKRDIVLTYFEAIIEKSRNHDTTCGIEGFVNLND